MIGYSRADLAAGRINWKMLTPSKFKPLDARIIAELKEFGVSQTPHEKEYFRKDRSRLPILIAIVMFDAEPDQGVAYVVDLSEQKAAQTRMQALAAERVKIVKAIAASIAHELNQPLAATGLFLSSAIQLSKLKEADRLAGIAETLEQANNQLFRAGRILKHLREFIAHGQPQTNMARLHDLIREALDETKVKMAERRIGVRFELNAANDEIFADITQIVQVLINLLRNAEEAIGDGASRSIIISTMSNETHIQVDIADTGCGLSQKVAAALFEPFVTTKAAGMGVGLVISRTIIEAHHGTLSAFANADGGATFYFTLPIISHSGLRDKRIAKPEIQQS